jgi:hypothetical protein
MAQGPGVKELKNKAKVQGTETWQFRNLAIWQSWLKIQEKKTHASPGSGVCNKVFSRTFLKARWTIYAEMEERSFHSLRR